MIQTYAIEWCGCACTKSKMTSMPHDHIIWILHKTGNDSKIWLESRNAEPWANKSATVVLGPCSPNVKTKRTNRFAATSVFISCASRTRNWNDASLANWIPLRLFYIALLLNIKNGISYLLRSKTASLAIMLRKLQFMQWNIMHQKEIYCSVGILN